LIPLLKRFPVRKKKKKTKRNQEGSKGSNTEGRFGPWKRAVFKDPKKSERESGDDASEKKNGKDVGSGLGRQGSREELWC